MFNGRILLRKIYRFNPVENTQKDSLAKELLSIYLAQMVPMNVSNEEARAMLEFFRKTDLKDPK